MIKRSSVCSIVMFILIPGLFAQLKYLNLSPSEFRPLTDNQDYYASSDYLMHIGGAYLVYNAPIHLPHGAVIKNVMICYYDNSSSYLNVSMFRKKCIDDSTSQPMLSWESIGNISYSRKKTIWGKDINYNTIYSGAYSYCVSILFSGSGLKIYGIRIAYE